MLTDEEIALHEKDKHFSMAVYAQAREANRLRELVQELWEMIRMVNIGGIPLPAELHRDVEAALEGTDANQN